MPGALETRTAIPGPPYASNVDGSAPEAEICQGHPLDTHHIPWIMMAALGKIKAICVFAYDCPTRD